MTGAAPRAVGVRAAYADVPAHVRGWVDDTLGSPVVTAVEQVGGMSPGCATRVRTAGGTRAFVKAVGPELNPDTPDLFRHEASVLDHLPDNPLWAAPLAVLDEPRERGGWVALLLEDVPSRHADTTDPRDVDRVVAATGELSAVLAGAAGSLEIPACRDNLDRCGPVWEAVPSLGEDVLPRWVSHHLDTLRASYEGLLEHAGGDHLVHGDLRNDNILVRTDERAGDVVFVDWGMARRGPAWWDPLLLCLEWVDDASFDARVHAFPALRELGDDHVTAFLATLGTWLAHRATVAVDTGLPTLRDFRRRESARLLDGARRRLGMAAR